MVQARIRNKNLQHDVEGEKKGQKREKVVWGEFQTRDHMENRRVQSCPNPT